MLVLKKLLTLLGLDCLRDIRQTGDFQGLCSEVDFKGFYQKVEMLIPIHALS